MDQFQGVAQQLLKQRHERGDFELVMMPEVHPRMFGDDGRFGVIADTLPPTGRQSVRRGADSSQLFTDDPPSGLGRSGIVSGAGIP